MARRKYDLVGVDGNAYAIMGYVSRAMKNEGCIQDQIDKYIASAKSDTYNHLLYVSALVINILNLDSNDKRQIARLLN